MVISEIVGRWEFKEETNRGREGCSVMTFSTFTLPSPFGRTPFYLHQTYMSKTMYGKCWISLLVQEGFEKSIVSDIISRIDSLEV